jgi:hypothetical protein
MRSWPTWGWPAGRSRSKHGRLSKEGSPRSGCGKGALAVLTPGLYHRGTVVFTFTYNYTYCDGRLVRVYAELHANSVWADILGSGATEEGAAAAALARWHRIPFDILTITGD